MGNIACRNSLSYTAWEFVIVYTQLNVITVLIPWNVFYLTSHQNLVSIHNFRVKIPFDFRNVYWILIFTYICPIYVIRVRLCDRRMCWLESRTTPWCASIGKQKQISLEVSNNLRTLKMTRWTKHKYINTYFWKRILRFEITRASCFYWNTLFLTTCELTHNMRASFVDSFCDHKFWHNMYYQNLKYLTSRNENLAFVRKNDRSNSMISLN